MTLLPASDFGIRGHPGNAYDVDPACSHPSCGKPSAETHHLWPRSYLRGQPYEWVRVEIGGTPVVIGNRLGFCVEHHRMLTGEIGGHRARLVFEGGIMFWENKSRPPTAFPAPAVRPPVWEPLGPLSNQPPAFLEDGTEIDHNHDGLDAGEICPTCGHHAKPKAPKPKRVKDDSEWRDWTARTPDADSLDETIENLAIPLGYTDHPIRTKRGLVLLMALAWVEQNRSEFISDVADALELRIGGA